MDGTRHGRDSRWQRSPCPSTGLRVVGVRGVGSVPWALFGEPAGLVASFSGRRPCRTALVSGTAGSDRAAAVSRSCSRIDVVSWSNVGTQAWSTWAGAKKTRRTGEGSSIRRRCRCRRVRADPQLPSDPVRLALPRSPEHEQCHGRRQHDRPDDRPQQSPASRSGRWNRLRGEDRRRADRSSVLDRWSRAPGAARPSPERIPVRGRTRVGAHDTSRTGGEVRGGRHDVEGDGRRGGDLRTP